MYQRKHAVADVMMSHASQRLQCSDVVNNNFTIEFEQCVINRLPYGMLLNSNLI